jgi:hypothetical protein
MSSVNSTPPFLPEDAPSAEVEINGQRIAAWWTPEFGEKLAKHPRVLAALEQERASKVTAGRAHVATKSGEEGPDATQ